MLLATAKAQIEVNFATIAAGQVTKLEDVRPQRNVFFVKNEVLSKI